VGHGAIKPAGEGGSPWGKLVWRTGAALTFLLASLSTAQASHQSGSVHVHGYTTRSGHYVAPYTRSAPYTYHVPAPPRAPHLSTRSTSPTGHSSTRALGAIHDSHGRIRRSATARLDFEHHHPCPSTGKTSGACAGYVVDHVVPLKRGGADAPSNMQWQTIDAAKAKDRWE